MKIKVGGIYVNRIGQVVTITKNNGSRFWPFHCSHGHSYTDSGRFLGHSDESGLDLIHELKDYGARASKLATFLTGAFWWVLGVCLLGFWVMMVTHWGPVVFPGG